MTPRKTLFYIGLILFLYACGKDESLNGSFQLSVSTDTSSSAIGDLIKFRVQTKSLGDNYLVIPQTQFNEPLELRHLEPLYNKNGKIAGSKFLDLRTQILSKKMKMFPSPVVAIKWAKSAYTRRLISKSEYLLITGEQPD